MVERSLPAAGSLLANEAYGSEGPPELSVAYYRRAIALLEATEDRFQLGVAHESCASALLDQGRAEEARAHLETAERIYVDEQRQAFLGSAKIEWARFYLQTEQVDEARASALAALDILDSVTATRDAPGTAWKTLADVLARLGEVELAESTYERTLEALGAGAAVKYLADAYRSYAEFLNELGRSQEAFELMRKAASLMASGSPASQEASRGAKGRRGH